MRPSFPIDDILPDIVAAARNVRYVAVVAPPGAGKTMAVPMALAQEWRLSPTKPSRIYVLEPRRVAARMAAHSAAAMLGEKVGETIGYHVRFDKQVSSRTQIIYCTEGILNRLLLEDPLLEQCAGVVLDEFHERHLDTDLALGALVDVLAVRDDFFMVVMSATLDVTVLQKTFSQLQVLHSAGFMHPVHISWQPCKTLDTLPDAVVRATKSILEDMNDDQGDILVFLPGQKEIHRCVEKLESWITQTKYILDVMAFHGQGDMKVHTRVFEQHGPRRIVLATNIAESSVTIPRVTVVIDSGWHRQPEFSLSTKTESLKTLRITKSNAAQRTGRAGRLAPGRCIRLWNELEEQQWIQHPTPEICRRELIDVALHISALRTGDPRKFFLLSQPAEAQWNHACQWIENAALVDTKHVSRWKLNMLGQRIAKAPLSPRQTLMIESFIENQYVQNQENISGVCIAALCAENRDMMRRYSRRHDDDFYDCYVQICRMVQTQFTAMFPEDKKALQQIAAHYRCSLNDVEPMSLDELSYFMAHAYSDRVCMVRHNGGNMAIRADGRAVMLPEHFSSTPSRENQRLWIALFLRSLENETRYDKAEMLLPLPRDVFDKVFASSIQETVQMNIIGDAGRPQLKRIVQWSSLILNETLCESPSPQEIHQAVIQSLKMQFSKWVNHTHEYDQLIARLMFVCQQSGKQMWTEPDEEEKIQWLLEEGTLLTCLRDVQNVKWETLLLQRLDYETMQNLKKFAPPNIKTPADTYCEIDYTPTLRGEKPCIAVRLQELLGLKTHPTIGMHFVPITIQLLSPARRPIQITSDLPRFWQTSYDDVKKDMRAEYPKHYWPDDPQNSVATTKTKAKM